MKAFHTIFKFLILCICLQACKGQPTIQIQNNMDSKTKPISLDQKIWAIHQDKNENYWFGSNSNGIYFQSGNTLSKFTTEDGLVDNTIRGFQEDQEGNIFIETPEGISKYDGKNFTTLKSIKPILSSWKSEEGDLWFNCNGNAFHVYRYDGQVLHELQLPRQNILEELGLYDIDSRFSPYTVFGIDKDQKGNLWFGTESAGAFRYDGNSFLWFGEKELSTLEDGRVPGVRSMIQDKNGYFWLSNFISKYKINEGNPSSYKKQKGFDVDKGALNEILPYFNSGIRDSERNLWMTTYGDGVWKYDGSQLKHYPVIDEEHEVLIITIYQDQQGTIWLGSNNRGVFKLDDGSFKRYDP